MKCILMIVLLVVCIALVHTAPDWWWTDSAEDGLSSDLRQDRAQQYQDEAAIRKYRKFLASAPGVLTG